MYRQLCLHTRRMKCKKLASNAILVPCTFPCLLLRKNVETSIVFKSLVQLQKMATQTPQTAATATGTSTARTTSKSQVELPDYFHEAADLSMLRQCFMKNDETNKDNVTHLTKVPYHEVVNFNDPSEFIYIKKELSLDNLRKIVAILKKGKGRATTRAVAFGMINEIANLEVTVGQLDELAASKRQYDQLLLGKTLMRLVGVLFGTTSVHYFAQLNDSKTVEDFERGTGRNDENFYAQVSDAVNANDNDQHLFLHPCNIPMDNTEYNKHISDEHMDANIHPSGRDTVIQTNPKWIRQTVIHLCKVRNKISFWMHQSGNGNNKPMDFVDNAIKACKVRSHVTIIAAYYFYMQCKFHDKVSEGITSTMPEFMNTGTFEITLFLIIYNY